MMKRDGEEAEKNKKREEIGKMTREIGGRK